jgi:hypothetical protein
VLDGETGKAVLIVAEGKVEARPITVEKEVGADAFVSSGLTGNETIIVGEQTNQLKPGDQVEVRAKP